MKREKNKNMAMVAMAATILLLANAGVWMAANKGMIEPVANNMLWSGFVVLNMVSILWAVTLLGLQPLVVAISYVAGGFLAFKGVQGMGGISVAEVTTAGATYGAFGALAVGNVTTKVRFAFYNKKQVPFLFIIIALLVFDAVLNSEISSAGGNVILNAVVFPFVLAGIVVGLVWSILIRYGIGHNPPRLQEHNEHHAAEAVEEEEESVALKIEIPEDAGIEEEMTETIPETIVQPEVTPEPAVKETLAPAAMAEEKDEDFFPLEIDKNDEFELSQEEYAMDSGTDEPFSMSGFDSDLYASGADDDVGGGVMVEEPVAAVKLDRNTEVAKAESVASAESPAESPAAPAAGKETEQKKEAKSDDWLNGHLDLLNKLK